MPQSLRRSSEISLGLLERALPAPWSKLAGARAASAMPPGLLGKPGDLGDLGDSDGSGNLGDLGDSGDLGHAPEAAEAGELGGLAEPGRASCAAEGAPLLLASCRPLGLGDLGGDGWPELLGLRLGLALPCCQRACIACCCLPELAELRGLCWDPRPELRDLLPGLPGPGETCR
mmetsp:Transcript_83666/g.259833  ORF Transcript_83666/g.259833 Transcript_83666/m.259833 type:complete len:174 (-) Transcript_83666:12-533(-)